MCIDDLHSHLRVDQPSTYLWKLFEKFYCVIEGSSDSDSCNGSHLSQPSKIESGVSDH